MLPFYVHIRENGFTISAGPFESLSAASEWAVETVEHYECVNYEVRFCRPGERPNWDVPDWAVTENDNT